MPKDHVSITLDKDVHQRIKAEARKQKRSFSSMVEYILAQCKTQ